MTGKHGGGWLRVERVRAIQERLERLGEYRRDLAARGERNSAAALWVDFQTAEALGELRRARLTPPEVYAARAAEARDAARGEGGAKVGAPHA